MSTVEVKEEVIKVVGCPTDTLSVYHTNTCHEVPTILVFIPGNPGLISWYRPLLVHLVENLGPGFIAKGISYAGHGVTDDITDVHNNEHVDSSIPFTIYGQVQHKIAYLDMISFEISKSKRQNKSFVKSHRFIFLSHSIGSHMVNHLLMLRPDILHRTTMVIHLMPYTRMKAPTQKQIILNAVSSSPQAVILISQSILKFIRFLPYLWVDYLMRAYVEDNNGREIATRLVRQPQFARNFFELGTEEVRDVPEEVDIFALRQIAKYCPIELLYCGDDHWAPECHLEDLRDLQGQSLIPKNVSFTYLPELRHDYVSYNHMVSTVHGWCLESIRRAGLGKRFNNMVTKTIRSRL